MVPSQHEHLVVCIELYVKHHLYNLFNLSAFSVLQGNHLQALQILEHLTLLSVGELIPYAEALTSNMNQLLYPGIPRRILQTVNRLWMALNTVMPRR